MLSARSQVLTTGMRAMITRGVQTQTNSVSATKTRGSRTFSEAISQETNFSNESNYKEFTTTLPITAAASTVVADVESPLVPPPKRRGRPPKSSIISAENQAVEAADRTATSGREERKSSPTRTTTTTTTTRRRAGAAPASTTHTWPSKPVSDRLLALEMKVPRIPKPAKAGDFGPTTDGPPVNLSDMHPLVQEVVSSMEQVRSQQQGIAISRYMRFLFPYLGAQRPVMQKASADILKGWTFTSPADFLRIAEELWLLPEREYQQITIDFIQFHRHHVPHSVMLPLLEALIRSKSWWDTVDNICGKLLGQVVVADRSVYQSVMEQWIDDEYMWIRRAAILHQLSLKEECNQDLLFKFALQRGHEEEFFIQKAIGWSLRQHARVAPAAVRSFVHTHADKLSKLSKAEALKHL